ncbi:MAG: polyprenyl synthetase family protein [Bacteroidetes bacterium]|nr:polyprenyl synthetase family protein [Bacteroidota bacterium]
MDLFESKFKEAMKSQVPLLDKITYYIIKRKGKQIRPMFVFLSAKMLGPISESSYRAASLIELLHTATLVHDDVVDDSYERRGFFSINALWKNKIAVLVGDYLLSRGLLLSVDNGEFKLLQIVSTAVREMSEGELLQIEKARKLDIAEDVYFDIIRQKTASLIASCCAAGACSVGATDDTIETMKKFGECVGIAFQIKDDLFDYGDGKDIGKPVGIDVQEKKLTLPIIYALKQASFIEKRKMISIIKNYNTDENKITELFNFVIEKGGITYAEQKMYEYKEKALNHLQHFENNTYKQSLINLVNFTIERKK